MTALEAAARPTLRLHRLTFVTESDGIMIGRPETGSYALFPVDGGRFVRRVHDRHDLGRCAEEYAATTGAPLDLSDLAELLDDLGFLLAADEELPPPTPVRWQRLGRAAFSPAAWVLYGAVLLAGGTAMVLHPELRPRYQNIFFTTHLSLIPLALALGQFPCLLIHEGYHALAGRRLGLPSRLGVGRRFYFVVAETRMDALYSVPRRQRYLPFVAGSLADLVMIAGLTVLSGVADRYGLPGWLAQLALALAFTAVLRVLWQGLFYLETDAYFVIATAAHCTDLQAATRARITNAVRSLLRRTSGVEVLTWSDRDERAARWYAPLLVAGYAVSAATLLLVGVPTSVHFWTTVYRRLAGPDRPAPGVVVDTVVFVAMSAGQFGLLIHVTVRDLRRRRRDRRTAHEGAMP